MPEQLSREELIERIRVLENEVAQSKVIKKTAAKIRGAAAHLYFNAGKLQR